MSGLLDSLKFAAGSLDAHRMGLNVAGQNLANVETPGYTRRTVVLAELPSSDPANAGRGVEVVEVLALRDLFVEGRIRQEYQGASLDEAVVRHLQQLEAAVGLPGASLDTELTKFFDAFTALASDPTSAAARDLVVRQGGDLGLAFSQLAGRLSQAGRDADVEIRDTVSEINALAARVATVNGLIATHGGDVNTLTDERTLLLEKLSGLTDIAVISRPDGVVDVSVAGGRPLVIGENSYDLQLTTSPAGATSIHASNFDITSSISGGRLAGLLAVRDTLVPAYAVQLDQLAYDLATAVNSAHSGGFDGNGAAAGVFFSAPGTVAGAAAALQVDAAVAADSSLVAASITGAPGDNQTAQAIAALQNAAIIAGGTATPAGAWGKFVFSLGGDLSSATQSAVSRGEVVRQLEGLRAQVSGVSVDEEAANLMRFQRAYEANARYFTTINDTLDVLMGMVQS